MSSSALALTDAYLIGIRDGFGTRRDAMLALQVSNPYPPDDPDVQLYVWHRLDYALAALYTNQDNVGANSQLIEVCNEFNSHHADYNDNSGIMTNDFDWCGELICRIYELFNSNSTYYPGRLTPTAQNAIAGLLWGWAKSKSVLTDADVSTHNNTWTFWSTENGNVSRNVTILEADQILKNVAPYNTYHYNDGYTAQQHYDAWTSYFKTYFNERAKHGLNIEIASPGYCKYTLQGYYNIYDFSNDAILKAMAGYFLDLWWTDWAHEQINCVRGGSKARVYQDRPADGLNGTDLHPADDAAYGMSYYNFAIGTANSKDPGIMCMATSTYRLPLVVMDIALDTSGKGTYEYKSRRMGLSASQYYNNSGMDGNGYYHFDPNGRIYKYSYCTPSFVMGTSMLEKRTETNWVGMSDQNRWHGVIFSTNANARIVPQVLGLLEAPDYTTGRTYNQQWSVQNKGTLIVQKLSTSVNTGPMRVYFSKKYFTINETGTNGWVFVNAGTAYAGVKPATGTYTWETVDHTDGGKTTHADPNWFRCSDQYAAVIIEVAQASDFTDFTTFQNTVKALPLSVVNNVVTYTGLGANGTFTFYTNASTLPKVNGTTISLTPTITFDSPFIHEDWLSGIISIQKDTRSEILDFDRLNGQWLFDSSSGTTVYDNSGHNRNGTLFGTPAWQPTSGVDKGALSFNGTSNYVQFGTAPSLNGNTDFTVMAWIKTSSANQQTIVQQRDTHYNGEFWLRTTTLGQATFAVFNSGYQFNFNSNNSVNDGKWHHVCAVRQGTAGYIYIDGYLDNQSSGTIQSLNSTIGIYAGVDFLSMDKYFSGKMDDLRIYRTALSGTEILNIFSTTPLKGWWRLDNYTGGTTVPDSSPIMNHGTAYGSPVWNSTGAIGGSLQCDGTNDYVSLGTLSSLNGDTDFTACAWVKTNYIAQDQAIIQQRDTNYHGEYWVNVKTTGYVNFIVFGSAYQFNFDSTVVPVNDGNWHHVAAVRSGTSGYIYIDGVLRGSATGTTVELLDSTISVTAGRDSKDSTKYFNGSLDDVRIYNVPLSQNAINNIFLKNW